ncbi:hypothetical protein GCM10010124_07170 [Pilimelia terevasa]|uniref:Uncharacterized protein n=1 Tax=Pilimelia terevasa TaxID=53372 RepID=A0A8J3BL87_9ACTN|nr:hypothetical protein GCM10010124_07170 [Pilimelia terevasa]
MQETSDEHCRVRLGGLSAGVMALTTPAAARDPDPGLAVGDATVTGAGDDSFVSPVVAPGLHAFGVTLSL